MENTGPFDDWQRAYMSLTAEQQGAYDRALNLVSDSDASDRQRERAQEVLDGLDALGQAHLEELDRRISEGDDLYL
jgi:hypothetical protein